MARTPKYWYDVIIAEKNSRAQLNVYQPNVDSAQTFLDDFNTVSVVQSWRCIFWCVAVCAWALDAVFDAYKVFLQGIASRSRFGTLPWYVAIAKEFQYGDSLVLIDNEWKFSPVNAANQIVSLAAARELNGSVLLKAANIPNAGAEPQALTAPQLTAFNLYIQQRKPAGIAVTVVSADPDEMRLFLAVNYDPLVLKSNGELISTPGVFPVEDAVKTYRLSLDFDGAFELMRMIDQVELATGVVSAYVTNATARSGANPFTAFAQRYYPDAGYVVIDPTTPLSGTITYTPAA